MHRHASSCHCDQPSCSNITNISLFSTTDGPLSHRHIIMIILVNLTKTKKADVWMELCAQNAKETKHSVTQVNVFSVCGTYICAFDPFSNDVSAIPDHKVCDGFRDWFDSSDEQGCRTFSTIHCFKRTCYLKEVMQKRAAFFMTSLA